MKRMAIQIGLRGQALKTYASNLIVEIVDITDFVRQQRFHVESTQFVDVTIPVERALKIDTALQNWLGIANAW